MTEKKKYTIRNSIMFAKVMSNKGLCVELLQMIFPERKIMDIRYIEADEAEDDGRKPIIEKTIFPAVDSKAVRLDVLFETVDSWNNIELQVLEEQELPKRCRYYHSAMDIAQLEPGKEYMALKATYVIFICCIDYFGLNEPVYFFESIDKKLSLHLEDESYTMILNTSCSPEKVPDALKTLFEYITTGEIGTIKDDFIKRMDQLVQYYNKDREVLGMMTLEENYRIREAYLTAESYAKGEAIGEARGKAEGKAEIAKKMKQDGISTEKIAEYTGLMSEEINNL